MNLVDDLRRHASNGNVRGVIPCSDVKMAADEIEELHAMLTEVRDKGLIYWHPTTKRGSAAKQDMLERIDNLLK